MLEGDTHTNRQHDSLIIPLPFVKTVDAKLNPICHLLALLRAHHILHVIRVRVNEKFGLIKRTGENTNELHIINDC
jgi:16S rRNA U1498 N3-methylase RsmE